MCSARDDGDVEQTNSVKSEANASNENDRRPVDRSGPVVRLVRLDRDPDGRPDGEERSGRARPVYRLTEGASNSNYPIRVHSEGDNGDVEQTNSVDSEANASNENSTEQSVEQEQSSEGGSDGKCCKSGSTGIQTASQKAESEQDAKAASLAFQEHAKNTNAPIRVHSDGDDGDVEQTNSVDSEANASNENDADSRSTRISLGERRQKCCSSGTRIQVADQKAKNDQDALGLSLAAQKGASNSNSPLRVKSEGDGGDVEQTNSVDSEANASNENSTEQEIEQEQSSEGGSDGKCCKSGSTGIQVASQKAENEQDATAASLALQEHAKNTNSPIRVKSEGDDGDVEQTNSVDSEANASNENEAEQSIDQDQSSESGSDSKCCCRGTGIQVAGQEAKNDQDALGLSLATERSVQ